jgi:hypothetical protein
MKIAQFFIEELKLEMIWKIKKKSSKDSDGIFENTKATKLVFYQNDL